MPVLDKSTEMVVSGNLVQTYIYVLGRGLKATFLQASLVAQTVKSLPAVQETQVQSLGRDWEDHLEKEMATQSSILAWEVPWTEEPGRLQSIRPHRVVHD